MSGHNDDSYWLFEITVMQILAAIDYQPHYD